MKHIHLTLVLLLNAFLVGCRIENPNWSSLTEGEKERAKIHIKKIALRDYDTASSWDSYWKGLDESERSFLKSKRATEAIEVEQYLYQPEPVKRFKTQAINGLRFSYFNDTGSDDPGEIDLFDNDDLSVSIDFYGIDYVPKQLNFTLAPNGEPLSMEWRSERWYRNLIPRAIGFNLTVGGGSTSGGSSDGVLYGFGSAGVFLEWFDFLGIEYGLAMGFSPDRGLDSTQRDDSARYYGVRLDLDRLKKFGKASWDGF